MNYGDIKKQLLKDFRMKKTIEVDVDYCIGEVVYLKVSNDNERGMVTSVVICPQAIMYTVTWNGLVSNHYAMELSPTPCYKLEEVEDGEV